MLSADTTAEGGLEEMNSPKGDAVKKGDIVSFVALVESDDGLEEGEDKLLDGCIVSLALSNEEGTPEDDK